MNIVVFAGSAEARRWINQSRKKNYKLFVFVDSEIGRELLPQENENLRIFVSKGEMEENLGSLPEEVALIIDGSFPYVQDFSRRIERLARRLESPYIRLLAEEKIPQGVRVFSSAKEARDYLEKTKGNILITSSMKSLVEFVCPRFHLRIFARVEPRLENIEKLLDLGLGHRQIIALTGPFSEKMNLAMIDQYNIKYLVTEESGLQEAVEEKTLAAIKKGVELLVIRDEDRRGYSLGEIDEEIDRLEALDR